MLTTDPNDPRLGYGVDAKPVPQNPVYLVLSDEERAKGFVRPVRDSYIHKGNQIKGTIRLLTQEEKEDYKNQNYVAFDEYPESESPLAGRYLTEEQLKSIKNGWYGGCGTLTKMNHTIAETYARNPKFYGSTYCCYCQKHLPVQEFVWDGTDEIVGS